MPALFHVSEQGPFDVMSPRVASDGGAAVWAVDDEHLVHYLLPRDCPRVCWVADGVTETLLASPAHRVVAVESGWTSRIAAVALNVHRLDPAGFALVDAAAGYWVSTTDARVQQVEVVDDCLTALAERGAELRVAPTIWPYRDAVVAGAREFSVIRMRNAVPAT